MKAGRELDALVQQHVFGKKVRHLVGRLYAWLYDGKSKHLHGLLQPVPDYSGDIAAAWQVVEKVIAEFPAPEYQFGVSWVSAEDGWSAGMGHFQNGESYSDEWYSVFGETAPHAICLAALKAKGIDV